MNRSSTQIKSLLTQYNTYLNKTIEKLRDDISNLKNDELDTITYHKNYISKLFELSNKLNSFNYLLSNEALELVFEVIKYISTTIIKLNNENYSFAFKKIYQCAYKQCCINISRIDFLKRVTFDMWNNVLQHKIHCSERDADSNKELIKEKATVGWCCFDLDKEQSINLLRDMYSEYCKTLNYNDKSHENDTVLGSYECLLGFALSCTHPKLAYNEGIKYYKTGIDRLRTTNNFQFATICSNYAIALVYAGDTAQSIINFRLAQEKMSKLFEEENHIDFAQFKFNFGYFIDMFPFISTLINNKQLKQDAYNMYKNAIANNDWKFDYGKFVNKYAISLPSHSKQEIGSLLDEAVQCVKTQFNWSNLDQLESCTNGILNVSFSLDYTTVIDVHNNSALLKALNDDTYQEGLDMLKQIYSIAKTKLNIMYYNNEHQKYKDYVKTAEIQCTIVMINYARAILLKNPSSDEAFELLSRAAVSGGMKILTDKIIRSEQYKSAITNNCVQVENMQFECDSKTILERLNVCTIELNIPGVTDQESFNSNQVNSIQKWIKNIMNGKTQYHGTNFLQKNINQQTSRELLTMALCSITYWLPSDTFSLFHTFSWFDNPMLNMNTSLVEEVFKSGNNIKILKKLTSSEIFARHTISGDRKQKITAWIEYTHLASRHPNSIMSLLAVKHRDKTVDVDVEYADYGSLFTFIPKIEVEHRTHVAMSVARQLLLSLMYFNIVHNKRHRNINPHTVLLRRDGCVKLDLYNYVERGLVELNEDHLLNSVFVAPELRSSVDLRVRDDNHSADIWAVGAIIVAIMMGNQLYPNTKLNRSTVQKITKTQEYNNFMNLIDHYHKTSNEDQFKVLIPNLELRFLVLQCLKLNPSERWTAIDGVAYIHLIGGLQYKQLDATSTQNSSDQNAIHPSINPKIIEGKDLYGKQIPNPWATYADSLVDFDDEVEVCNLIMKSALTSQYTIPTDNICISDINSGECGETFKNIKAMLDLECQSHKMKRAVDGKKSTVDKIMRNAQKQRQTLAWLSLSKVIEVVRSKKNEK
jgi:Protein kinase domain